MSSFSLRLAGLAVCVAASPAFAAESVTVVGQGFCMKKTDQKCEEIALPETNVSLERLPKGPDGKRVIYFYSDVAPSSAGTILHALETEDAEKAADVVVASGDKALSGKLKTLAGKIGKGGAVLLTAFRVDQKTTRVFSSIAVPGPGVVTGQVIDADGAAIPKSSRISFTVIRGDTNGKGSDQMGVTEADG